VLVQGEVGDQALQASVLVAQLAELPDLGEPELAVLLLPHVEARLAHAHLPTDVPYWRASLGLPQRESDLLLRVPRLLHALISRAEDPRSQLSPVLICRRKVGRGQGDSGQPAADVCRQMGIHEAAYCNRETRYRNVAGNEVRRNR